MIEMFDEVADDQVCVEELKIWLLKQKQTSHWKTTKQTSEAVYALLLKGSNLLASDELVQVTIGDQNIQYTDHPNQKEQIVFFHPPLVTMVMDYFEAMEYFKSMDYSKAMDYILAMD